MNELQNLIEQISNNDWNAIQKSPLRFVRSQDHLAVYNSGAKGWELTPFQVAKYYPNKISDILEYGVAVLPCSKCEPAESIIAARESLGLSIEDIARFAQVTPDDVKDAENQDTRTPMHILQNIAPIIKLDDANLSILSKKGEYRLGGRLRTFNQDNKITKQDVMAFSEAAWVAQTQLKLESWLKIKSAFSLDLFEKNSNYGNRDCPAWKVGYTLAGETRKILGIGQTPVCLRETCGKLGIPVIQTELSHNIAGATISTENVRAIVVANDQRHKDIFIRRMTIAHELGHLLWDTEVNLHEIRFDLFDDVGVNPQSDFKGKYIEQRVNAFAVNFIAPLTQHTTDGTYDDDVSLCDFINKYGLSTTSANYHLCNMLEKKIPFPKRLNENIDRGSWDGIESSGIDYFTIASTPISRRGMFAYRVVQCYQKKMLSDATAASYLKCNIEDFHDHIQSIVEMFE